jgi:hypothetical protein
LNSQPEEKECCKQCGLCAYVVAVLGAFLIVAGLVWVMVQYTRQEPLGADRAAARRKALAELKASNEDVLNNPNYVWVNQPKGIVRLPIQRAMALSFELWQNPAAGRSNLIARVEKATAVPPPQVLE